MKIIGTFEEFRLSSIALQKEQSVKEDQCAASKKSYVLLQMQSYFYANLKSHNTLDKAFIFIKLLIREKNRSAGWYGSVCGSQKEPGRLAWSSTVCQGT